MYSRTNPYFSRVKERTLLTGPSSTKKTYHIALELEGVHFPYKVGDSIGIFPTNDPEEVEKILKILRNPGTEIVHDSRANLALPFREFLLHKTNLSKGNSALLKLLLEKGAPQNQIAPLLDSENKAHLSEFLQNHTLLDLISLAPVTPTELAKLCLPLLPRFYSIANSDKVYPGEIHLLVAYVQYHLNGQTRHGVGSHFLCDLAQIQETPIPIYLQPSNHFTLPPDPEASLIMIGPGTGVAPYRAFLQERIANQASGRNWLIFGERNRASDFYYESFWKDLEKQNRLRLDLAFSRDANEKVYVQHKMYEHRKSLWKWIEEGAYLYVCGDATRMAKDVDAMLHQIAREEGNMSEEDARLYLKKLRKERRCLADVY